MRKTQIDSSSILYVGVLPAYVFSMNYMHVVPLGASDSLKLGFKTVMRHFEDTSNQT